MKEYFLMLRRSDQRDGFANKATSSTKPEVFASIPFGFGTRMCPGRRIAELELHLLLARIVQQFDIRYPSDAEEVKPYIRGVTIPDRPVRAKFVNRKNVTYCPKRDIFHN